MVFFKTLKMTPFSTSKWKKWSNFFCIFSLHMTFLSIFENNLPLNFFFQKFSKIFGLEFFKLWYFLRHQITIIRLILENGLFLWNQSGFTVVSNFSIWNHLRPKVVSSNFGGFFFLDKVSRPKNDQNLAQIHHMLGFKFYPPLRYLAL